MPYRIEDILNKVNKEVPASNPVHDQQPASPILVEAEEEKETYLTTSTDETTPVVIDTVANKNEEVEKEVNEQTNKVKKGYFIIRHGNHELLLKTDTAKDLKQLLVYHKEKLGLPSLSATTINRFVKTYNNQGELKRLEDKVREGENILVFVDHQEKG